MWDSQCPRLPAYGWNMFGAGDLSFLHSSYASAPTDASSGETCGNQLQRDPSTSASHGGNSHRWSRQYNRHENGQYLEGPQGLDHLVGQSKWAQIWSLPDCQGTHHPSWPATTAHTDELPTSICTHGTSWQPTVTPLPGVSTAGIRPLGLLLWAGTHPHILFRSAHWRGKWYSPLQWTWKTNPRTKRKKWSRDIPISTWIQVHVNLGVHPGSCSTRVAGRGSICYGFTTAASAAACCKISAVSEGQCSEDGLSLMDRPTAVRNQWVPFWSVYR